MKGKECIQEKKNAKIFKFDSESNSNCERILISKVTQKKCALKDNKYKDQFKILKDYK